MKFKVTDNTDLRELIIKKLSENKIRYGARYCPCVNPELYDASCICPCEDFVSNVPVGEECHCGLYIKEEE